MDTVGSEKDFIFDLFCTYCHLLPLCLLLHLVLLLFCFTSLPCVFFYFISPTSSSAPHPSFFCSFSPMSSLSFYRCLSLFFLFCLIIFHHIYRQPPKPSLISFFLFSQPHSSLHLSFLCLILLSLSFPSPLPLHSLHLYWPAAGETRKGRGNNTHPS